MGVKMEATNTSYILYLVRHGETDGNANNLLHGHSDIPLNQDGIFQASELQKKLSDVKFAAAYSSDLSRAMKTCEIILDEKKIDIIKSPKLRERDMGPLEGKHIDELRKYSEAHRYAESMTKKEFLFHRWHKEIESSGEVFERFKEFIDQQISSLPEGSTILIASHGGVLRSVIDELIFLPDQKMRISNCAFLILKIRKNELKLVEKHGIEFI